MMSFRIGARLHLDQPAAGLGIALPEQVADSLLRTVNVGERNQQVDRRFPG